MHGGERERRRRKNGDGGRSVCERREKIIRVRVW